MLWIVSSSILKSFRLAPSIASPTGIPAASASKLRLTPPLARSVGLGPVFFPAQWRLRHRAVRGQPRPADPLEPVVVQKSPLPELQEHSALRPLLKPSIRRGTC